MNKEIQTESEKIVKDDRKIINLINEYGTMTIDLKLPPIFKFIDPMFEGKMLIYFSPAWEFVGYED